MNHDQILGGLLGCGVVIALAIGLIAMYVRQGVELLRGWTVEKDAPEAVGDGSGTERMVPIVDPNSGRVLFRDGKPVMGPIQIGIKR